MNKSKHPDNQDNLDLVRKIIEELNSGHFDIEYEINEKNGKLEAILSGISLLSLELKSSKLTQELVNKLFEGVGDLLMVIDKDLKILRTNNKIPAFTSLIETKDFSSFLQNPNDIEHIKQCIEHHTSVDSMECEIRVSGKVYYISVTILSIDTEEQNSGNQFLVILKDLSKLRRVESELKSKNEELESFLYSASHHLKGPLATILGLTNIVNENTSIEEFQEYFAYIKETSQKLNDTLIDLVEFPKYGEYNHTVELIDIKTTITQLIKEISLEQDFSPNDYELILQLEGTNNFQSVKTIFSSILHHLLENAFRFQKNSPNAALIKIETEHLDNGLQITITDNGPGIKEEYQPRIFELFKTASPVNQGTGMGLYIVKNQVQRLGGKIQLYSMSKIGTTAVLWLPNLQKAELIAS